MKITAGMMRPELRFWGSLQRALLPAFSEKGLRFASRICEIIPKGARRIKGVHRESVYVARNDGSSLRIALYVPEKKTENAVGLLWLHGGGYALGWPEQDAGFIGDFIEASGCVVAAPDYTLSARKPYPAALEDAYLALLWLRDNAEQYSVDTDRLFVGGGSAGGGLAAALCIYARDRGEVNIAFQMPLYPMLDDRETAASCDNDAPGWNTRSNRAAWKVYLAGAKEAEKYAAPSRESDLSGLPDGITFIGSLDPFLDETESFVSAAAAAGTNIEFKLFEGCFHAFNTLCPRSAAAGEAREFLLKGFSAAVKRCESGNVRK